MPRWSSLLLALIPGCKTATKVAYKHEPTSAPVASWDLDAPALAPFSRDGVVFAPWHVDRSYTETLFRLMLVSRTRTEVTLRAATLSGAQPASAPPRTATLNTLAKVEEPAENGLYKAELTLFELPTADVEALSAGGDLTLTLDLPQGSGDAAPMTFTIERVERTWTVTR